ncbi:MAG: DUF481 domain-containing protein [Candidatus Omnitrophica bacterium]|nr:DUF481 domain-containing protein [Candidatus Omnitrophota bacterium]
MKHVFFIVGMFFLFSSTAIVSADEVYLKNGDRLTGVVTVNDESEIQVESEAMGTILIKKEFVKNIVSSDALAEKKDESVEEKKEEVAWKRDLSAGYNLSSGNTEKSQFAAALSLSRKTGRDEWSLKAASFYSSADKKMDSQKWDGSLRYAFSFGESLRAYNFYRFDVDHDRFANIDYRLTPFAGLGYWFFDEEAIKWKGELGVGFEHTSFRDDQKDKDEAILIPRFYSEHALIGKSRLTKDIALYLPFNDIESYRVHGEVSFINPLDEHLSLKISVIDDFDSNPSEDTKKNDVRFISSLVYSF